MTEPDSTRVEQTLRISAHPETVWHYWTDPERMSDWWGSADLDPRPGGTCRVDMGRERVMRGEYVELVPFERIVLSFGWEPSGGAPAMPPGSTQVEVTLTPDGGDTIMTLRHTGIPAAEVEAHGTGWHHFLPILADVAARQREAR